MAKPKNSFEVMARSAAERLDKVRAEGEQLSLLPDEPGRTVAEAGAGQVGRPRGAKNKVSNQMREFLSASGYQMPEDMLAQMAGLATREDAILTAMQNAERVLAWAYDGATKKVKGKGEVPAGPSASARLATFLQLYTVQLRAADALLPYGAPKATPDVQVNQHVNVVVPVQQGQPGDTARVVSPAPGGRMAPPPLPSETVINQGLSGSETEGADE